MVSHPNRRFPGAAFCVALGLAFLGMIGSLRAADSLPLWEIPASEESAHIYLLADFVLLGSKDFPLASPIEAAYEQADVVLVATRDDPDPGEFFEVFFAENARAETPLSQQLDEKLSTRLKNLLHKLELPYDSFEKLHPWAAAVVIYQIAAPHRAHISPNFALEYYFRTKAQVDGKEVVGVQYASQFLEAVHAMAPEDQAEYLRQTLNEITLLRNYRSELRVNWQIGNTPALENLVARSNVGNAVVEQQLQRAPAETWVNTLSRLQTEHPGQTLFAIVPMNQLLGPHGVLQKMREKNENLRQLNE